MVFEGGCWPDPDPTLGGSRGVRVDDVTRMNGTEVEALAFVRDAADVRQVLRRAVREGRGVSVRGTKHSMGGHTIAPGGLVIDMSRMCALAYDPASAHATVGAGATWSDVIMFLNQFGRSPRTMQSYSSFSVGGTVAVNAHGITTDHCMYESVVGFKLVKWDGTEVDCAQGAEGEAGELFGLAIGGFGMFGIITELTLRTVPNTHLHMELVRCDMSDFPALYRGVLADEDVEIKLARVDVNNMRDVTMFIFRNASLPGQHTVSPLPLQPRQLGFTSQLLYKWLVPAMSPLRYAAERALGRAADWAGQNERNLLMFESAEPLARLYSALFDVDASFVLQEYFMPLASLREWVSRATPVLRTNALQHVTLLNLTVRFVKHDEVTALP